MSDILSMSLDTANRLYSWGWGFSVIGIVVTMLGMAMLWLGARVRDQDIGAQRAALLSEAAQVRDRAADLELRSSEFERARRDAATTRERERADRAALLSEVAQVRDRAADLELRSGESERARLDLATTLERERADRAALLSEVAQVREQVASLTLRSSQSERANLDLATSLERERTTRLRMQADAASRHLGAEQKATLVKGLKGLALSATVSAYNDPEALAYAREVISALRAAGVTVTEGGHVNGTALAGLSVEENADARLTGALFASGLATHRMPSAQSALSRKGESANAIFIGIKPGPRSHIS